VETKAAKVSATSKERLYKQAERTEDHSKRHSFHNTFRKCASLSRDDNLETLIETVPNLSTAREEHHNYKARER